MRILSGLRWPQTVHAVQPLASIPDIAGRTLGRIACILATLELGSSLTLTDGNPVPKFPFQPLVVRAVAIAQGTQPFLVIPNY